MPEVTPVYVAKSDEPLSAQILHNTSARGKKSQHRAIDLLEPTIWEWEKAHDLIYKQNVQ